MNRSTEAGDTYFFCDQCSEIRLSRSRTIILTNRGVEIVRDTCSYCGVVQEIEMVGKGHVETFRIRDNGFGKNSNKAG